MKALTKYRNRRDFSRTAEPTGQASGSVRGKALPKGAPGLSFVVQKHDARRLHYDFRLELDGVLLSWAIPKGPSLNPEVKRLAVEVEPHPLEYGDFEGTIPQGEYGGGTVMVWDRGSWQPEGDARSALAEGHLRFTLHGEKLKGAWHLVRTKGAKAGKAAGKTWLLFKSRDASARAGQELPQADISALSGRDLAHIAANDRGARLPTLLESPLANPPRGAAGRGVHWVPPELAAQVRFSELTADGRLRHPSFEGLREDKPAAGVQLETAAPLPPPQAGFVLSNPHKVLYPELGITKQELLDYYALVAERMLPHVANRPLTLLRCLGGREKCFFQKHPGAGSLPGLRSVTIAEKKGKAPYSVLDARAVCSAWCSSVRWRSIPGARGLTTTSTQTS